jgi:hypothetical protein
MPLKGPVLGAVDFNSSARQLLATKESTGKGTITSPQPREESED